MAVYSIFKALGLTVRVRPVLQIEKEPSPDYPYEIEMDDDGDEYSYVGTDLHDVWHTAVGASECETRDDILREFPAKWLHVTWLTYHEPHSNTGLVHMTVCKRATLAPN